MDSIAEESHIESNPQVCGGRPCIAGTRIRVQDIYVCHELQGMSPDQIVAAYPKLGLADVHAALAYYFDHRDQIRKDMIEESAFVAGIRAMTGPGPLEGIASEGDDALHLDENVDHAVAVGLRGRGIDVTTSTDARLVSASWWAASSI